MSKITVTRALAFRLGKRAIRFFGRLVIGLLCVLLLVTCALVYFFSPWWWLLVIPISVLLIFFIILRLIVVFLLARIYGRRLDDSQRDALDSFIDKVQALLEARATPPWVFFLITLKDIVFHRDITTVKKLTRDSVNLRQDFNELEKLF